MAQKQMGRRRANGIALTDIHKPLPSDVSGYTTLPDLFQGSIDVVGILAARARVAPATIRAQLAAWQIGGANA